MASSLPKMARAMERWSWETVCEVAVGIVENAAPSCYNIDDGAAVCVVCAADFGRLAQLVRALPSHGRGQRFKSFVAHHLLSLSKFHSSGKPSFRPGCVGLCFYVELLSKETF